MSQGTSPLGKVSWIVRGPGLGLGFLWGFAEGTLFFIIPDLVITVAALFSFKQSLKQLGVVLAGSLLGGWVVFSLAARDYPAARKAVAGVPFVSERMFQVTRSDYETSGVWALCKGPLSGIPYKVYAVEAPGHASLLSFLSVSIPGRLERLVITWVLFAGVGLALRKPIARHVGLAVLGYGLYWISVYAYYWSVIR